MKNFGSILAFVALAATIISARVLPAENGLQVRDAEISQLVPRYPKKEKGKKHGGAGLAGAAAASNGNSIVAVGANSTAAANGTAVAGTAANSTASDTGKKTKGTKAGKKGAEAGKKGKAVPAQANEGNLAAVLKGLTGVSRNDISL